MLIIHGENTVGSRNLLHQKIEEAKNSGIKDNINLNGKNATLEEFKQALESQSLFGTDRLVVVENLVTRPKSKLKTQILEYLNQENPANLYIWEGKKLTKTAIKPLSNAKDQEFKPPTIIFSFLDSLGGDSKVVMNKFKECVAKDSPESVFFMISRQVRLMLQTLDNNARMAPWQKKNLSSQLNKISLEKVLWLHQNLLAIDEKTKTGQSSMGMEGELELLLAKL